MSTLAKAIRMKLLTYMPGRTTSDLTKHLARRNSSAVNIPIVHNSVSLGIEKSQDSSSKFGTNNAKNNKANLIRL